jgi:hypothetical protein
MGGDWYTATYTSPVGLGPTFGKHERTSEFLVSNQHEGTRYKLVKMTITLLIPQVRPAHKYPISPWEMIHLPGGDNAVGR